MKKIVSIVLTGAVILSLGGIAFAGSFDSPAEILANLTGKTVEKLYEEKGDKTFGQLAAEDEEIFEQFRDQMLESKKAIIEQRVEEKLLTQEEADKILAQMEENCTLNPGEGKRLGQEYNLRFQFGKNGQGQGMGMGRGQGRGQGKGFRWNN